MNVQLFQGTFTILKLLLRQSKLKIAIWVFSLVAVTVLAAASYGGVYTSNEEILGFGITMDNPAMKAMLGPGYELSRYNLGAVFANEMLLFTAVAVIVMNILLVGSTTRNDEEEGRLELIRSLPTGPLAYLVASSIMITIVNILFILLTGLGLSLLGESSITVGGAFLYSTVLGTTGLFFGALTGLTAQLAQTSRGTSALAFGALFVSYLLRAIGDVDVEVLSLISPLGWTTRSQVFVENFWWPCFALLGGTIVFSSFALFFNQRRDIGAGILPQVPGRKSALGYLKTPIGLVWRLERTNLICWAIGIFLMSSAFGAVVGDLETHFSDMEMLKAFFPENPSFSMSEQFTTMLFGIMSIFTAVPGLVTILKLRKDEKLGLTENYYSRAISRNTIMFCYYLVGLISALVMQFGIALGLFLGTQGSQEALAFSTTIKATFAYLPAIWLVISLGVLVVGCIPKATSVVWVYIIFTFMVLYLAGLLNLPEWLNSLSAFYHIPKIPLDSISPLPLLTLSILAAAFAYVGFFGYNKRDIA